jgi:two-component system cell cycle sensor histidine kinase/response regulator CckA
MKTVLITDDEPIVLTLLRTVLSQSGFRVLAASGGQEAMQLYEDHRQDINLVLLDVRMPTLDGPQTLDALRDRGLDVPVVFLSGDMGNYDPEELLQRGASQVLYKPFDSLTQLCQTLRELAG